MVEHPLCFLQVEIVFRIDPPRQVDHVLQVVELHTVFRTLRIVKLQLVEFLVECCRNFFIPFLILGLLQKLTMFR